MSTPLLTATEDLDVLTGPSLLRHAEQPLDHAGHRRLYGPVPRLTVAELIALADGAGVRGRGGAGFPFGRKLRTVAEQAGPRRRPVIVVNASEGEPASAKDAALAIVAPHLVLDGAVAVATALGAREIHLALPGERPRARALLSAAVAERDDPRIHWHVHVTDPRFVAGQARAVLELLAGRPGLPVTAWQPEAFAGHRDRPTLLSNAETWAHLGWLALVGLRPVLSLGTPEEPGTTLLTVRAPGHRARVVEVEHGAPLAPLVPASGRGGPVLVGGFHGTWTTWESVASASVSVSALRARGIGLGAGAVIALGSGGCAVRTTADIVAYLAEQSAGRCGPCINGMPALALALAGLRDGVPNAEAEVVRLSRALPGRGACAHPDGTARLAASLLAAVPDEVAAHQESGCTAHTTGIADPAAAVRPS